MIAGEGRGDNDGREVVDDFLIDPVNEGGEVASGAVAGPCGIPLKPTVEMSSG